MLKCTHGEYRNLIFETVKVILVNNKIKSVFADKLFEYILTMNTVDECYQLFEDLCMALMVISWPLTGLMKKIKINNIFRGKL